MADASDRSDDIDNAKSHDASPSPGARVDRSHEGQGTESDFFSGLGGERVRNWALFVPRLLKLIGRLVADAEVPGVEKVILGAAVLYVIGPFDLVPDSIPVLGQLDDVYLLSLCLLRLLHHSGEAKLRQHWDGPEDIVQLLETVTVYAIAFLPAPARNVIVRWVEGQASKPAG